LSTYSLEKTGKYVPVQAVEPEPKQFGMGGAGA